VRVYISETEIVELELDTEIGPESDENVPSGPQLVGIVPPIPTSVRKWVDVLRWKVPVAGLFVSVLARQVMPPASLIRKEEPMTCTIIEVMLGRVPEKPEYLTCQGSVSVRMVAEPEEQVPRKALVM